MAKRYRRHIAKTSPQYYSRRGFLPEESYYLSEISQAGRQAPYIQAMIRRRISLNANRVRLKWSYSEYRRRVLAEYGKMEVRIKGKWETYRHYFLHTFYDYLTAYKERTPTDPEWETPRRKKYGKRIPKETKPQTTKRRQLRQKIDDLNYKIGRASLRGEQGERQKLERERNFYQLQLDMLK